MPVPAFAIYPKRIKFVRLNDEYSIAAYWSDGMDEGWPGGLGAAAAGAAAGDGGVAGAGLHVAKFFPHARQVLEILRLHGRIPLLAGCSSGSLVATPRKSSPPAGWCWRSIRAGRQAQGRPILPRKMSRRRATSTTGRWKRAWPRRTSTVGSPFIDPFHLDAESWLRSWNKSYASVPIYGGLAAGNLPEPLTQVYLDGEVFEDGGVAVAVGGEVTLAASLRKAARPLARLGH